MTDLHDEEQRLRSDPLAPELTSYLAHITDRPLPARHWSPDMSTAHPRRPFLAATAMAAVAGIAVIGGIGVASHRLPGQTGPLPAASSTAGGSRAAVYIEVESTDHQRGTVYRVPADGGPSQTVRGPQPLTHSSQDSSDLSPLGTDIKVTSGPDGKGTIVWTGHPTHAFDLGAAPGFQGSTSDPTRSLLATTVDIPDTTPSSASSTPGVLVLRNRLVVLDLTTGQVRRLGAPSTVLVSPLRWTPDGIIVSRADSNAGAWAEQLLNPVTGAVVKETTFPTGGTPPIGMLQTSPDGHWVAEQQLTTDAAGHQQFRSITAHRLGATPTTVVTPAAGNSVELAGIDDSGAVLYADFGSGATPDPASLRLYVTDGKASHVIPGFATDYGLMYGSAVPGGGWVVEAGSASGQVTLWRLDGRSARAIATQPGFPSGVLVLPS